MWAAEAGLISSSAESRTDAHNAHSFYARVVFVLLVVAFNKLKPDDKDLKPDMSILALINGWLNIHFLVGVSLLRCVYNTWKKQTAWDLSGFRCFPSMYCWLFMTV